MMELCAAAHPYYSRVMAEQGFFPTDFSTVDDLHKLQPLPKQRFIEDPEAFRLKLDDVPGLTTEETTLADIIYTAGSTSKPTPFYDNVHDRFGRIQLLKRATTVAGIVPGDIVMNLFPVSSVPHQGFLSASWGAMAVGAKLLTGLTGRPYEPFPVHNRMDHAIDMIERERATVIWGITAYVRRLIVRAQQQGRDFGAVRLAMVMGEACPQGMRDDIRTRLVAMGSDSPWTNNGYGLTETLGPATECMEGGGMHQPLSEQYYFEVVDPETYEPVPDGQPGMMLVSHLNRRGTVLLRYVSGDIVSITHETCPNCGRTAPRFLGAPYRADGLTKVKGTLINPASLHEDMTHLLQRGVAEYQVVIGREDAADPYSGDMLLVRVAAADEDRDRLRAEVISTVTHSVEITPQVEFLEADGFAEIAGGYKFKRYVDER
jgi:phenylacetate-coenzyme A ligase PaaK-like adenylate-forming protein